MSSEIKGSGKQIGGIMEKNAMVLPVIKSDGSKMDILLNRERFDHADLHKTMPSIRFGDMDGWSILDALVPIIVFFRPGCIVEIGAGESTRHLGRVAELYGVKLYSCDKAPIKNKKYFDDHIFVQKFSHDFMDEFDDTPSVVLIDADHSYEMAKMEFDFFFERLVPGGVIFLHDTMPPSEEFIHEEACDDVYRLRQELEKRDDLDCFTWPYTAQFMGLTMVMKKETDRPYWEK